MTRILYCIILLLFPAIFLQAGSLTDNQQALSSITQRIHTLKKNIAASSNEKKTIHNELSNLTIEIQSLTDIINDLNRHLNEVRKELEEIHHEESGLKEQLHQEQLQLAEQIRAAYQLGQHETLKLLLNQENPNQVHLMMAYYDAFNRERTHMIQETQTTLDALLALRRATLEKQNKIYHLNQNKYRHLKQMQIAKAFQQKLLSSLDDKIDHQSQELTTLHKNKRALEELLQRLQAQQQYETPVEQPQGERTFSLPNGRFHQLKRRLPWPTQGRIEQAAMSKAESETFNGVFFSAREDNPVQAVYDGKVVYADWLRGYGLLLILEHPGGFMTLYGHNNNLYFKTGQSVKAGQVIATVGKTGGFEKSGLYFEIREQGKPVNPRLWLSQTA